MVTIPTTLYGLYEDGMSTIINQFGKNCLLIFPAINTPCNNCYFDPNTGRSTGIYNTTGPNPFPEGQVCPSCHGVGISAESPTKTIKMVAKWNPADYKRYGIEVDKPEGLVKTTTFIEHLVDIENAAYVLIDSDVDMPYKCRKIRESIPRGIHTSKYVRTFWQRLS